MAKGQRRGKEKARRHKFNASELRALRQRNTTPRQDYSIQRRMHRGKVAYPTLAEAQAKADSMTGRLGVSITGYNAYQCGFCGKYHVGGAYTPEISGANEYAQRQIRQSLLIRLVWALGDLITFKEAKVVNFITFIGNLGRDPEMRYTPSGAGMTSFSVAENNKYTKGDGESVEETQWFNCTAWGRLAEVCNQYLSKGSQVMIVGRLTHRLYNAQDGSTRVSLDVNVEKMQMCGGRGELDTGGQGTERRPTNNGQQRRPQPAGRNYDDMDIGQDDIDDLPF